MANSQHEQSMKSIVFIITTLRRSGPVNILFDLVKYLDRSVYKPHIITLCEEEGDSRWGEFEAEGVSLEGLDLPRGWRFFLASGRIKTVVADMQPAVVHCFGFRGDLIGAVHLGQYLKVSSQLNYPFDDYVMTYGKVVGGMMAHLTILALKRYDVTVACANDVALKMQCKGVPAKVVYNAIDDTIVDDMIKAGIIDPVKVTRSAVQHAASAAAILLTTEVAIADEPEEKKAMTGAGMGMDY